MSRAFVKEHNGTEVPEDLPERPVSTHPNFVTTRGLKQIESRVRELEQDREQAKEADDKTILSRIERDLRYWQQRKASARLTVPEHVESDNLLKVRFGMRVTLQPLGADSGNQVRRFVLVGEDEANPSEERISWISPVGQQLLGKQVGDEIEWLGRHAEILAIDIPAD